MYTKEEIRALLPQTAQKKFDDIITSRVLGANTHIRLIGEIMVDIANDSVLNGREIREHIVKTAQYFKDTRGQQSRAIYNAINYFTKGFEELINKEKRDIVHIIISQVQQYAKQANHNIEKLISYGVTLCEKMDTIMVFDYSSTVDTFLKALPAGKHIYIPESRALDGGKPFVETAVQAGHDVHFIPDTTMLFALKKCQAAFMGAETFYPDGTVFNTIGSDILAVLCEYLRKPLYVLTPFIKVDTRSIYGYIRLSPMPFDYSCRLAKDWEKPIKDKVDFSGFKLLEIPSKQITAFISEKGIIPAAAMYTNALLYAKSLEGESHE